MMAKFKLDPANPPRMSEEERVRFAAMTDEEIERDQSQDEDAKPPSDEMLHRAVIARRLRRVRERLSLSQSQFCARFRIPEGTLRDWEQARRTPDATSLAYIAVIESEPELVERVLHAA